MTAISTAVGLERRSRVSGYRISKGFFNDTTTNLPQIIAVFGEANDANQGTLSTVKKEVTSAQEAGELYGFGSPIHQMMRILRPVNSAGVAGIPTVVFPQESDAGATATIIGWTVTGTATSNATHTVVINGRDGLDFQNYSFSIVLGDTPTLIAAKIADAVNGVLGSPVSAVAAVGVVTFTTKWKGLTSAKTNINIDNLSVNAGISYSETTNTAGAGDVVLTTSFAQFGTEWYTTVINPYATKLDEFEQFNGVPYGASPTGRYNAIEFLPFTAFFGSVESDKDNLVAITNAAARVDQLTNVLCPAPNSLGFDWEAAANMVALFSRIAQDTPQLTVSNLAYADMPSPSDAIIGDMSDYNNRDFLVKKGCSTVTLANGAYKVQDLVTTYHPEGEIPLQYAYPRNLNIDWNVKDGYGILETQNVKDHVIIADSQVSDAQRTIKPRQWAAVLYDYFESLAERALIREPEFSKESLLVQRGVTNPDRFETFFRYRRTGIARIQSTDAEAGF
tara:strand:+ start:1182 stop:2699 length:1518 start_codon:yes stop_codon:yes gene_type:complete